MRLHGRDLRKPMSGDDVASLQEELLKLGLGVPADESNGELYGPGTEEAVKVFQSTHDLDPTGVVDSDTVIRINRGRGGTHFFVVKGRVVHADGRPFGNRTVRAFNVNLRNEERLGEYRTEGDGHFAIRYRAGRFGPAETALADLVVRAYDADGTEAAASPVIFNAEPDRTIDLVVGGSEYRGPTEYERLMKKIQPLLEGVSIEELTEDDEHRDLSFLSGETNIDPIPIALAVKAHRLAKASDLSPEILYGLLRRRPDFLAQGPEAQRRALLDSIEDNVIGSSVDVDEVLDEVHRLVVRQALEPTEAPERAAAARLVAMVIADRDKQEAFLSACFDRTRSSEAFWPELEARPELRDHVEDLRFVHQVGVLARMHIPLVEALFQMKREGGIAGLADLVRLDEDDWFRMVTEPRGERAIGVPAEVPGADDEKKARSYARAMVHMMEDAYPTAFVAKRLEKDDLPGKDDLLTFFNGNPEFDLRVTRVDRYLRDRPDALAGVTDADGTRERVKALQRVYKLTSRYAQASTLLKRGIDSAHRITGMGGDFVWKLGRDLGGRSVAKLIRDNASQVESKAQILIEDFVRSDGTVGMAAVPDEPVTELDGAPEWSTLFGSLQLCECQHGRSVYSPSAYLVDVLDFLGNRSAEVRGKSVKDVLFERRPDLGEIELTCENTNTTLPYVDLVNEALEDAVAPPAEFTPFTLSDELQADLDSRTVSHGLRAAFAPPLSPQAVITVGNRGKPWKLAQPWWTVDELGFTYTIRKTDELRVVTRSRQTKGSAAERAAGPQYVNARAYETLRRQVHPWSLPFDLGSEESRTYLGHLGVPRHRIMEVFWPPERRTILERPPHAREYLGLDPEEARILTGETAARPGADSPGPWNLWGFAEETLSAAHSIPDPADRTRRLIGGNWLDVLRGRVDVFLQQSGLRYKELLEVLDAHFVNPIVGGARKIRIVSKDPANPETCETHRLRLVGFDEPGAIRILRFVRLWRRLGWSARDLDRAITAFGPARLGGLGRLPSHIEANEALLVKLAHVRRLHDELGVPVVHLLGWWAPIDTALYIDHTKPGQPPMPSLYEQMFRDRGVANPPDAAFGEEPSALAGTLSEHEGTLTAALRINADDLALLIADADVIPRSAADPTRPDDALSLENLSRLHRHSSLCRALRLRISDYLSALKLTGREPFASTVDTVLFVEQAARVRDTEFSFAELDYLLRHEFSPSAGLAPDERAIAITFEEIRSGVQTISAENTFSDDPADPTGVTADPDGELTREKLSLLAWDEALVDRAVATLGDAVTYEAVLDSLPAGLELPNATGGYEVDLAALPSGFALPAELSGAVTHDPGQGKLRALRPMTPSERTLLRDAAASTGDAAFLAACEALFLRQDELRGALAYDADARRLRFTGAMSQIRRDRLLAASPDVAYQAAIGELFDAPRRFVARHMKGYSVRDFAAPLEDAPTTFPKTLGRKVYLDQAAEPKQLHFVGVMTEQERGLLREVSSEPAWVAAVDSLFDQADAVVPEADDTFLAPGETDVLFEAATEDRFLRVLERLMGHLRRRLSEQLVTQKMAETLGLETGMAAALLGHWIASPVDPETDPLPERRALAELLEPGFTESNPNLSITAESFPAQFRTYTLLHKVATLVAKLGIGPDELGRLFERGTTTGWLDPNGLPTVAEAPDAPFEGWRRLVELFELRDRLPMGRQVLAEIFGLADEAGVAEADLLERVSEQTEWSLADLRFLVGTEGLVLTLPGAFRDERALGRLRACFALAKRTGLSVRECRALADGEVTPEQARGVRQAVRAKYDETQWHEVAKPLRGVLREKQRAALVTCLLHTIDDTGRHLRDAEDLYAHFLMDVEMSPCMLTSRIKQAISSTQLFVQRCRMSLEPAAATGGTDWEQWEWMKNYRVWEANRKVFLYPENWIEPELRDDKSPFFKELEGELLQADLNEESAEQALLNYLDKLDEVARLEIVGMYHQKEVDGDGVPRVDILHVFGRTYEVPHVHYYRKWVDGQYWTAWERVDADIEGDHLIPVVWSRRLYLFWPVFMEITVPTSAGPFTEPDKQWEVKIAWSEHKQGKWTNKKVSSAPSHVPSQPGLEKRDFLFRSWVDGRNLLHIAVTHRGWLDPEQADDSAFLFRFDGCHADPFPIDARFYPYSVGSLQGATFDRMFLVEADDNKPLYLPAPGDTEALRETPGSFRVLPPSDGTGICTHPFFYLDDTRTFFVVPSETDRPSVEQPPPDRAVIPGFYDEEFSRVPDLVGPVTDPADIVSFEPTFTVGPALDLSAQFGTQGAGPSAGLGGARAAMSPGLLASAGMPARMLYGGLERGPQSWVPTSGPPGPGGPGTALRARDVAERVLGGHILRPGMTIAPCYRFGFSTFYHPYVPAFVRVLNQYGVDGLFQRRVQTHPTNFMPRPPSGPVPRPLDFEQAYDPTGIVEDTYPVEEVDFEETGAYAQYNWELFFHVPLLIADRLSKNQRFEEAQKWFHYIFNPTDTSSPSVPQRYWQTKKFFVTTSAEYRKERIQFLLKLLATGGDPAKRAALEPGEREALVDFESAVERWRRDPFKPHLVARLRTTAYQKAVVLKYLDNLIAWGDQLFRRDSIESINEATQLYILAAEILGHRPEEIPPRAEPQVQTFNSLEPRLGAFRNALVEMEQFVSPTRHPVVTRGNAPRVTLPAMLYFGVPKNDKLLGYWDKVADRLFKIRHCMTIEGMVRQLPLFEAPIDPGLLVKAVAAGVDISSVLNDISAGQPRYRFNVLGRKAAELCGELKSLGSALLAALEKRDAEQLALIRAGHETALLESVEQVKQQQCEEAEQNQVALRHSRQVNVARYLHYQKLLGAQGPKIPPEGDPIAEHPLSAHISIEEEGGVKMIPFEKEELLEAAEAIVGERLAAMAEFVAQTAYFVPTAEAEPWGIGVSFGGQHLGPAAEAFANRFRAEALDHTFQGTRAGKLAQFALRAHDWALQSNLAGKEIMQVDQQLLAGEIRAAMAERELENHRKQIENAQQLEEFMKDKYTNQELYSWMVGQLAGVYFQTYQTVYDLAKRAERAYRYELGLKDSSYIQFGYWDSLRKGLLAGEKLQHDLQRMEVAYLEQNRREYELTKHVSLAQLDPLALVRLKETGECFVQLPEALFDLDYPGHYMRRLRSVGVTIPCVTGPYAGVSCTLTLLRHAVRHAGTVSNGKYARGEEDPRFTDSRGAIQSIVTSSGRDDSGLFEPSLRDERYLPFEGAGALSEWRIELPRDFRQFDYDTISDVVLHVRYTAREAGGLLSQQAATELRAAMNELVQSGGQQGLVSAFSLRHQFPDEWNGFVAPAPESTAQELTIRLDKTRLPFMLKDKRLDVQQVVVALMLDEPELYRKGGALPIRVKHPDGSETTSELAPQATLGGQPGAWIARTFTIDRDAVEIRLKVDESDLSAVAPELIQASNGRPRLDHARVKDLVLAMNYVIAS